MVRVEQEHYTPCPTVSTATQPERWAWCWVLAFAFVLGACSHPTESPDSHSPFLHGVSLSPQLEPFVKEARAQLASTLTSCPADSLLDLRRSLEIDIQRPRSRDRARDHLFSLWSAQPTNFLWIDLAYRYRYLLGQSQFYRDMTASGVLADTTSAPANFLLGCREEYVGGGGPYFRRTVAPELDPLSKVLLQLKLADVESRTGKALDSVRRMQHSLTMAQEVGGARLSSEVWQRLAEGLLAADRLDDALHAVEVAQSFASRVADGYGALVARRLRGQILAARREHEAAFSEWDACAEAAFEADLPWPLTTTLDLAAGLALSISDPATALRYDSQVLDLRLAMGDSLNIPRVMTNVAYDYRLLALPDSSHAVLQRARRWVDAYENAANLTLMPMFEAEHWCYVGQYARAESLLSASAGRVPGRSFPHEEAQFLVSQARLGTESGLPDLAYRSLARLRELQDQFYDSTPEQNLRADLELISAELLSKQGEFRRAQAALARARDVIAEGGEDAKRWEYHRCAGELALLRGDVSGARIELERAWELALGGGDPDRQAESRFRLAYVLFRLGESSVVQDLLDPVGGDSSYGGRFRTQLSSRVLLGMIRAREGRFEAAMAQLDSALNRTTSRSPLDLVAMLQIERGRVLREMGDDRSAVQAARSALASLDRLGDRWRTPEGRAMSERPRRDATELLIGLLHARPELLGGGDLAASTLVLARECRGGGASVDTGESPSLVFFVGQAQSYEWARGDAGWSLRALPGRDSLRVWIDPVVFDTSAPGRIVDGVAARKLRDELLIPLRGSLREGELLRIEAEDVLAAVPWAAVPWFDDGPLLDHVAIAEVHDRGSPGRSPSQVARGQLNLLSVGANGNAGENSGNQTLRSAEVEARQIAEAWPHERFTLRVGDAAQWTELRQLDLNDFGVIHIASHAVLHQGQPQRSTLRLAAGEEAEPLTLDAIRRLRLSAELIYLSCCEAALPQGGGGPLDDFAGAFLDAGARAVIASRHRVDDEASAHLAERFYRNWLSGADAARALRSAQLETRAARPDWEHPFYWASYRVIGHRR